MGRTKERKKIIHEPSTQEIFACLKSMQNWSKILYEHGPEKDYKSVLKKLLDAKYFDDDKNKITIKKVASAFTIKAALATKWLHEIYDDILDLNYDKPELFSNNKTIASFYCSYYDSTATINLGIDVLPRVFENFSFFFMKGKVGIDFFWVSRVDYAVNDGKVEPTIWLQGGIPNRYREMAVEEGVFKGWLHFTDLWDKPSYEIDEILLSRLRR